MIIIGSTAQLFRIPDNRVPRDIDLIGEYDEANAFLDNLKLKERYPISDKKLYAKTEFDEIFEIEIAWPGSTGHELLGMPSDGTTITMWGTDVGVPTLNQLYALKMSHRYLKNSSHFLKTMEDIRTMRNHGAMIPEELIPWFKRREKETYTYKHPSLKRNKNEFFNPDEGIDYVYDHDTIHEAIKIGKVPAYRRFMSDGNEVHSSREKFENLPFNVRMHAVMEETYVLALERSQIPHPSTPLKKSFDIALEKVCTSITSGWFREFAWENYRTAQFMYDPLYLEKFNRGVRDGIVKPYKRP